MLRRAQQAYCVVIRRDGRAEAPNRVFRGSRSGRLAVALVALLIGCADLRNQPTTQPNPPIVTAAGTLNPATVDRYATIAVFVPDATGVPGSGTIVESQLTTLLLSAGFTVVERSRLQQVFEEQKLQLQHADETARAVAIGKLAGAQAIAMGTISDWTQKQYSNGIGSSVTLGVKLIDVESGTILFTAQGYYDRPFGNSAKLIADLLLRNISAHLVSAVLGSRGMIGVAWQLAEQDGRRVAVITEIGPKLPAAQAGLVAGDVILSCNGHSSAAWKTLRQSLRECGAAPGQEKILEILHGGEQRILRLVARDLITYVREKTTAY